MNFYKLEFDGKNVRTDADEHFVIFVKAETEQGAIDSVVEAYQASNIQVLNK